MKPLHSRAILPGIVLFYLILGSLFAVYTPPWQAPDEPAHYNYVRYLADEGQFPVLHMGDYPHAYLEEIKAAKFPPTLSIDPIRYEFHQPPLYYALLAPVYALSQGSLLALRLVSVLLGAGIVLLTYAIGRRVFPARPGLALAAAAFLAFLPQHLATVSQVGNDVLAELLLAATLYVLVGWGLRTRDWGLGSGERKGGGSGADSHVTNLPIYQSTSFPLPALGLLLGLILITKTTAYIAVPLAAAALIWRWWQERAGWRRIVGEAAVILLPAALIVLPWYARNVSIYGWPDFLGLQRHDAIVAGQMRLADFVAQQGWAAYWRRAVEWTCKSFVGVLGWMGIWLDSRVYFALALLGGMALSGGLWRMAHGAWRIADGERQRVGKGCPPSAIGYLLSASALLTFLAYVWYNTQFLQHQGRYLFTALIPIALAFAAGWDAVVRPGAGRWLAAGLALLAAGLAAWGMLSGAGLPEWPIAITAAAAVGALLLDLALTWLNRQRKRQPILGHAHSLLHTAALTFPYAFLAIVALYALFGELVPQLT